MLRVQVSQRTQRNQIEIRMLGNAQAAGCQNFVIKCEHFCFHGNKVTRSDDTVKCVHPENFRSGARILDMSPMQVEL